MRFFARLAIPRTTASAAGLRHAAQGGRPRERGICALISDQLALSLAARLAVALPSLPSAKEDPDGYLERLKILGSRLVTQRN